MSTRKINWALLRCVFLLMVVLYHSTFIAPLVYHQFRPRTFVFAHQIGASLLLALSALSSRPPPEEGARAGFSVDASRLSSASQPEQAEPTTTPITVGETETRPEVCDDRPVPARGDRSARRSDGSCPVARQRVVGGIAAVAAVLVALAVLLALRLPDAVVADHWSLAWAGFDVLTAAAAAGTAVLLHHGDPRAALPAAAGSALLAIDAWMDVTTSAAGALACSPSSRPPRSRSRSPCWRSCSRSGSWPRLTRPADSYPRPTRTTSRLHP